MSTSPQSTRVVAVNEHVVDLLLVEEIYCSLDFIRWLLSKIDFAGTSPAVASINDVRVFHSISDAAGETDVVVDLSCEVDGVQELVRLLIENKVNAGFQHRQPERYLARLESSRERGECKRGACILVAPNSYLIAQPGCEHFHSRIAYEELLAYFESPRSQTADELDRRRLYRRELLNQALTRKVNEWNISGDGTAFFTKVYELSLAIAPDLRMPMPGEKSSDGWIFWFIAFFSG